MASKYLIPDFKSKAADLLLSLPTKMINTPMTWIEEKVEGVKLHTIFRKMTIGSFLKSVCGMGGKIPVPYCLLLEAIFSIFITEEPSTPIEILPAKDPEEIISIKSPKVTRPSIAVLGKGEGPIFERILDVINGATYYMISKGGKGNHRQGKLIDHFCNTSGNFDATSKEFGYTRQNVEMAVKRFNQILLEGKSWNGLDKLYTIDHKLIKELNELAPTLSGRLLAGLKNIIGKVEGTPLDYILRMLNYEIASYGGMKFIIERGKVIYYNRLFDSVRRTLSKSVEPISFESLSKGLASPEITFLKRYLSITPGVKFLEDGSVIITGSSLEKAVRQARIIYNSEGWISKDEIAGLYEAEYGEPLGAFSARALQKLGCTNHNKLGYWMYGTKKVSKIKDLVLNIMTAEKPIATYQTIFKAVRANGLIYPESTIRACITDVACPETKNHDLFCLKGYTHLFPTLSWRSYKKVPVGLPA